MQRGRGRGKERRRGREWEEKEREGINSQTPCLIRQNFRKTSGSSALPLSI